MKYFIILVLLFSSCLVWSQSLTFLYKGRVENNDIGGFEQGVKVSVVQNGSSLFNTTTASSGKYTLRGDINYTSPFEVVFSKDGLVSKKVSFDFTRINEEDLPAGDEYRPVEALDMSMFKKRENVDFSFLDSQPVAKFDWNTRKMEADLDDVASADIKVKILKLLAEAEKNKADAEINYQKAITEADKFFTEVNYEAALTKYEEALGYKPTEKYPADKILELDALIQAQKQEDLAEKQENEAYYAAIEEADRLRDQDQLESAVSKYEEALVLKVEQYPKDQVIALNDRIDAKKKELENQVKYDEAINRGDAFLKQNSLRAAKDMYTNASKLKPSEQYPLDKLKELEAKLNTLADQEAEKIKYQDAIEVADALFEKESYQSSKAKYEEALSIESAATYPKNRIVICDEKIAELAAQKEKAENIARLLSEGNAAITSTDWGNAKLKFTEVLSIDNGNVEAIEKLALVITEIEKANDVEALEVKFNSLVKEGDVAFIGEEFDNSLVKYNEALGIKTTPELEQKIADANAKIQELKELADQKAANKAKKDQYDFAIAAADNHFSEASWNEAIAKYREALTFDDSQTYPSARILKIEGIIAEEKANSDKEAANLAMKEKYDALIAEADGHFNTSSWDNSIAKYREAIMIDETQPYPTDRISEIEGLIADEKVNADKEAADLAKKEKYDALIAEADGHFNTSSWDNSIAKYREAISIDDTQTYPTDRISKIEGLIAEEKVNADKEAADLAKKEQYDAKILEADNQFNAANWDDAITKYREAITIDNSQNYPVERISEIEAEIAAKKSEAEQLAVEQTKQEEIQKLLEEGKTLFENDELTSAVTKYESVLAIENTNTKALDRIEAIKALIQQQSDTNALDEAFTKLRDEGYQLASEDNLDSAVEKLNGALAIKDDSDVQEKMEELKKLIEENKASKKLKEKYAQVIASAQTKEVSEDFAGAIMKYEEASSLKPNEIIPIEKIEELKTIIANRAANEIIDKKYSVLMLEADGLMSAKVYLGAIDKYKEALNVKDEQEPKDKIEEALRLDNAKKLNANALYSELLTQAESFIDSKKYDQAITLLETAKGQRPNDLRPDTMLDRIALLRKSEREYLSLMDAGNALEASKDYEDAILKFSAAGQKIREAKEPEERIAEMRKLIAEEASARQQEKLYKRYMSSGEESQAERNFIMALSHYQNALSVKVADLKAQNKIDEIQQILDDLSNTQSIELDLKNKFDALVKIADGLFSAEDYISAKNKYEEALSLMPRNSYVELQIKECVIQSKIKSVAEEEQNYQKILRVADKYFSTEDYDKSIEYYKRALKFRVNDPYPKEKLAEIHAILNPAFIESAELTDLGDPFDNSIMDGAFILAKAESERRSLKNTKIEQELRGIENEYTARSAEKTKSHYETTNDIYLIYQRITVEAGENQLTQQEISEALRRAKLELEIKDSDNIRFENAENLNDQNILYGINKSSKIDYSEREVVYQENTDIMNAYTKSAAEKRGRIFADDYKLNIDDQGALYEINEKSAIDYGERESVYQENTDIMKDYNTSHATARSAEITTDYYANIKSDQELNTIKSKFDDGVIERTQERHEVGVKIDEIGDYERDAYSTMNSRKSGQLLINQGELALIEIAAQETAENESKQALTNSEVLKEGNRELSIAHEGENYRETKKYQLNKQLIAEEVEVSGEINEIAEDALAEKIEYVNRMNKTSRANHVEALKGDLGSRMNAEESISTIYAEVSDDAIDEKKKLEQNNNALVQLDKTLKADIAADNIGQTDKHYDAQKKLSKINDAPKNKSIIPNSLGEAYPEGVSEESFTRSDQDGLVKTIITRRVVVIEAHANVYIRTQSLNGITYSKNGKPSLSSVWSSETQGPHLERHY